MKIELLTCLMLSVSLCRADATQIKQLFNAMLSGSPYKAIPTLDEVDSNLSGVKALPAGDVEALLTLAKQCPHALNLKCAGPG